jgi:hypothetical protein
LLLTKSRYPAEFGKPVRAVTDCPLQQTRESPTYYLAEFTGLDPAFVRRLVAGEKNASLQTVIALAMALVSDPERFKADPMVAQVLSRLVAAAMADAVAGGRRRVWSLEPAQRVPEGGRHALPQSSGIASPPFFEMPNGCKSRAAPQGSAPLFDRGQPLRDHRQRGGRLMLIADIATGHSNVGVRGGDRRVAGDLLDLM